MTACQIEIEFEGESSFKLGDEIGGVIEVEANQHCVCDQLTLTYYWSTSGLSARDVGEKAGQAMPDPISSGLNALTGGANDDSLLPQGKNVVTGSQQNVTIARDAHFETGDKQTFEFSFRAPSGPCSYDGELVKVDWHAVASAQFVDSDNVRADKKFELLPGRTESFNLGPGKLPTEHQHQASEATPEWPKFLGGVFVFLAGLTGLGVEIGVPTVQTKLHAFYVVGMAAGLYLGYRGIEDYLASSEFETLAVDVSEPEVSPGETVNIELEGKTKKEVEIEDLTFRLRGEEWIEYDELGRGHDPLQADHSGKPRIATKTREHSLCEITEPASPELKDKTLSAGEKFHAEASFEIPDDAPCSFEAPRNRIRWWVDIEIEKAGPDWSEKRRLVVRPERPNS